jgi:ABC-type multidrug transport system fused ATPase/permease subunit
VIKMLDSRFLRRSPKLTLYTFAIVPLMAIAAFVFRWKVREAYRAVRVKIARINTQIQETVTGMKVVQLFSREARNLDEFDRMNADHRNAWYQSIRYDSLLFSTIEVATGVTMAIIIGIGTGLAEAGIMYVFIDYMQRFFMPLRDLSAKYSVMQSAMASSERIFQLLDTEPGVGTSPRNPRDRPVRPGPRRVRPRLVPLAVRGGVEGRDRRGRAAEEATGPRECPSGSRPARRSPSSVRPVPGRRRSSSS